ncbi:uncharacterized protein SOCG_02006 [Schizosaccharomyces octosporus yFS286]|uniref:Fungal protein n=1 Tax=Schizosaccharomyces octosporus (strain yFS286) TaxID=483514 RepID=S9Q4E8_SCHOY|nr:uncharacterized protein SOCG_02006 [Schizosaccharomyces octosporus yFS286]EPX74523.1 fungal protein [Schizosaccharomyces octosporus yFS286]
MTKIMFRKRIVKRYLFIIALFIAGTLFLQNTPAFNTKIPSLDVHPKTPVSKKFQEYRTNFISSLKTAKPPSNTIMFAAYGLEFPTHSLFMLACDMALKSESPVSFLLLVDGSQPLDLLELNRETEASCPLNLSFVNEINKFAKELTLEELIALQFQQALKNFSPSVIITSKQSSQVMKDAIDPYLANNYYTHNVIDTNALEENAWVSSLDTESLKHFRTPRINVVLIAEEDSYKEIPNMLSDLKKDYHSFDEYPYVFIHIYLLNTFPDLKAIRNKWPQDRLFVQLHQGKKPQEFIELWAPPNDYTYALFVDMTKDFPIELSSKLLTWYKYLILTTFYKEDSSIVRNNIMSIVSSSEVVSENPVTFFQRKLSSVSLFTPIAFQKFQEYVFARKFVPDFNVPNIIQDEYDDDPTVFKQVGNLLTEFQSLLGLYSLVVSPMNDGPFDSLKFDSLVSDFLKFPPNISFPQLSLAPVFHSFDDELLSFSSAKNKSTDLYQSVSGCAQSDVLSTFSIQSIFCPKSS